MEANFFERVYEIARQIPEGKVTSYGAIAKALGTARSARMVGWAMNASHNMDDVPAHRVVNRKGLLSGKHHFTCWSRQQQIPTIFARADYYYYHAGNLVVWI